MRHEWKTSGGTFHFVDSDHPSLGPLSDEILRLSARVDDLQNFRRDVSILLGLGVEAPPFEDVQARVWEYTSRIQDLENLRERLLAFNRDLSTTETGKLYARIAELEADNARLHAAWVASDRAVSDVLAALALDLEAAEADPAPLGEIFSREINTLKDDAKTLRNTNAMLGKENRELKSQLQATLDSLALANETAKMHQREAERLRTKGFEQAKRIDALRMDKAHQTEMLATVVERDAALKQRLAKLDALLASGRVPDGLMAAMLGSMPFTERVEAAWQWFRETLGAKENPDLDAPGKPNVRIDVVADLPPAAVEPRIGSKEWEQRALERGWKPELKSQPPPPAAIEGAQAVAGPHPQDEAAWEWYRSVKDELPPGNLRMEAALQGFAAGVKWERQRHDGLPE